MSATEYGVVAGLSGVLLVFVWVPVLFCGVYARFAKLQAPVRFALVGGACSIGAAALLQSLVAIPGSLVANMVLPQLDANGSSVAHFLWQPVRFFEEWAFFINAVVELSMAVVIARFLAARWHKALAAVRVATQPGIQPDGPASGGSTG